MFTNADMTLYHYVDGAYIRQEIYDVFWDSVKQSNVNKSGLSTADSVFIAIPAASAKNLIITTGKDLAVKGIIANVIDNTSQQTQSESLKTLKAGYEVFTVTAFDPKLYGSESMQHYELSCK